MTYRAEERTTDTGQAFQGGPGMSALKAAAALGLSERTIRRAIARDELRATKRAGVYQITPDDLAQYGRSREALISLASRLRHNPTRLITLPARTHSHIFNVPRPLTPLIGRESELGELRKRLLVEDVQLVTLTGPGGVGKTRLALEAAATLHDAFHDGVWFIDLLPLTDPARVPGAIARALEVRDTGGRSLTKRLSAFLEKRQALLILDNFERVTDAAPFLLTLLVSCYKLKVLVTSRVSLNVSGERQFPVSPLQCPDTGTTLSLAEVASSGAVRLFVVRAESAKPDFELTTTNMVAVATLCRRLDGLPLAIELAAARMKHFNPSGMLLRLDRRFDLLTGGMKDQPSRMQSMRDAIAWSYELLTSDEQRLFRRLSVFVDGFTLGAAIAVSEGNEPDAEDRGPDGDEASAASGSSSVLEGVSSLIDKSLVEQVRAPVVEPRFTMLETLREFGLEQLEVSGEMERIQQRHASWCFTLAESVEAERIGLAPPTGADRLGPDRNNVRAALTWLRDWGEVNTALRLSSALWPLWMDRGEVSEGRACLTALLAVPGASADKSVWAQAMCVSGALAQILGDHDQAADLSRQALTLFQQLGDLRGEAFALNTLGLDAMSQGNYPESERILRDSMTRFRTVGDPRAGGWAMRHLSGLAYRHGDVARATALAGEALSFVQQTGDRIDIARLMLNVSLMAVTHLDLERAEALGEEALVLFREEGDRWGEAYALIRLGRVAQEHGDLALASDFLEASLALLQDIGDPEGVAVVLGHLGWVKRAQGAQPAAARHFAGELALGRERHHPKSIADALLGEGALALDRGDVRTGGVAWDECLRIAVELEDRMIIAAALEWSSHLAASGTARTAAHVLGAASAMRDRFGFPPGARLVDEHKNIVRGLRSQLGEASFKSAFEEGRGLPPDEAIAEARVILDQAISDPTVVPLSALSNPSRAGLAGLSPREVEVLRLLVEGHSNAEIGDALFIGVRTVRAHVASILAKLDVPTRTAASSYAIRHDLV